MRELERSLEDLDFCLVGPGKVGTSLASWLVAGGARARAVAGRPGSLAARALASQLGAEASELEELPTGCGLLLVAVPDPALDSVAKRLAERESAAVALHASGSRDGRALAPLAARGTAVGSWHPLRAFPRALDSPGSSAGTVFGVDGEPAALALAQRLSAAVGGRAVLVPAASRRTYHLAATLAAGGVVTLLALGQELVRQAGLPEELLAGYLSLAQGALAEVEKLGEPLGAATGPVVRGDAGTVLAALAEVAGRDAELAGFVARLGAATLELLRRQQGLSETQRALAGKLAAFLEERA
ncbi:MAG: Rossmann-like and DUF2520 domain-containing protein [Thermoanaerobaculia bacterium]